MDYGELCVRKEMFRPNGCTHLLLLDGLVDQERSTKSSLLRNLLGFNGMSEFGREGDVGDGDVVHDEVKSQRPSCEILSNKSGNLQAHNQSSVPSNKGVLCPRTISR